MIIIIFIVIIIIIIMLFNFKHNAGGPPGYDVSFFLQQPINVHN